MKFNKWTLGLAAVGVVSLASAARADEKMSQLNTALSNTTLSGYVDVGGQYVSAVNAPYFAGGSTAGANSMGLNVVDIALDKPLDATPFSAGYHVELWTGPGANILGTGSIVRQAYLALGTTIAGQEIDWKIGVWDTIIGYEGLTSSGNPNYTHSYGFAAEPTTHTGVLGSYKVNDIVSVQAGISDEEAGNLATINGSLAPTTPGSTQYGLTSPELLALVALTAPDSFGPLKGATLSIGGTYNTFDTGPKNLYVGASIPTPLAALKFGAAYDYSDFGLSAGHVNVLGVYATYAATDKLSFSGRGEYVDLDLPGASGQHIEEFTATAQYALWANVLSRLEVRWDHNETTSAFSNNGFASAQKNAFFMGAQVIYTF